jgi:hypothetical protein
VGAGLEPQLAPLAAAYVLLLALLAPVLMRFPEALLALWRGDERRDAHAGQRAAVRRWRS